jgi:hypothetical protein
MPSDRWIDDLRADRIDQALDHLRKELQGPSLFPSNYFNLGAVHMWSGDYQSALTLFDDQIREALPRNPPADAAFGMAGAAAWCLGDEKSAVSYWQDGTTSGYAVAGANTRTSLLLYAASVLKPDTFPAEAARKLLREKVSHWRVKNWPGPLAQYIVGAVPEEEAEPKTAYRDNDPAEPNPHSWQFAFYKLLKSSAASANGMRTLESGFQNLLNVKGSQYLAGINFFYFLRLEEFYLARHWSSKRSGPQLT